MVADLVGAGGFAPGELCSGRRGLGDRPGGRLKIRQLADMGRILTKSRYSRILCPEHGPLCMGRTDHPTVKVSLPATFCHQNVCTPNSRRNRLEGYLEEMRATRSGAPGGQMPSRRGCAPTLAYAGLRAADGCGVPLSLGATQAATPRLSTARPRPPRPGPGSTPGPGQRRAPASPAARSGPDSPGTGPGRTLGGGCGGRGGGPGGGKGGGKGGGGRSGKRRRAIRQLTVGDGCAAVAGGGGRLAARKDGEAIGGAVSFASWRLDLGRDGGLGQGRRSRARKDSPVGGGLGRSGRISSWRRARGTATPGPVPGAASDVGAGAGFASWRLAWLPGGRVP